MEATRSNKRTRVASALALSITALLILVNARAEPLTSVNQAKPAKDARGELERLIAVLIERGDDATIKGTIATVIGLDKPSNVKQQQVIVKQDNKGVDSRTCFVALSDDAQKTPMCLFIKRSRQTTETAESKYFKVNLSGKLEDAVVWSGKRTATQAIRGSGVKTERDIDSPEVKKEFNAEMAYWLKDWLKKESKTPSKKDSASTTPAAGKTATAAL